MAMDFLEICARMTSACPWPEGAEEQPALTESGSRIVSACASVAYSLLTEAERQRPPIDREALARALHDAFGSGGRTVGDWGDRNEDTRQGYLAEADTAIRLCAGADAGARIADLEARIATLTATANAAVERAEKAEADLGTECLDANNRGRAWGQRLAASALRGVLSGKGYVINEMTDDLQEQMRALKNHLLKQDVERHDAVARAMARADGAEAARAFMVAEVTRMRAERDTATAHAAQMQADRREMIDHAERLLKRAEEAEVRAAKAEKALRLSADAAEAATTDEEDARRDLYDARAENDRLRRALYTATQATAHMSTVAALLTGEADDA